MTLALALFTFINAWWIMAFFVLPFGIERNDGSNKLEYAGAPKPVNWKKKLTIITLLALAVTLVLAAIINSHLVSLSE